ncbi:CheB methylesterase domain-containing protein [Tropicibacter naphthalenivorans]|uniref:protein-glutamate methylesterase n=1 Tax=Tropicibacter naphthalenivorans TaxID=441103 RepID=A0A0P1GJV0_9RHOB|nr:CheB methylesterase domain-containing protein [Tropicibacter naphthalenivorans]CUH82420.1 Chemotaxis response regulator protein-glutamate methylesterase of group 3 operon [Tropicibacter naphthalenivorans]SMD06315.1 CheB methylesterase [Tropicibacter naphthalenivorans]
MHNLRQSLGKMVQLKNAPNQRSDDPIILIGASTGGIDALLKVLADFGEDCPPTLVVQHTGRGFGESLANLLDKKCKAKVTLAQEEGPIQIGKVIIGAGSQAHLVIKNAPSLMYKLTDFGNVSGHMPSVDALFDSATHLGPRIRAALLTGMGRDGAEGLRKLRLAGAKTIAQDEESSVVYGMPRAAMENGGVELCLPLDKIGAALLADASSRNPKVGGSFK